MFGYDLEAEFTHLQGDSPFFYAECVLTIYLLLSQGIMSEKFLMPSLSNISKRYGFNSSIAGLLIGFGIAVPDIAVTIISFQRHGIKMVEFGLAVIFGGVVFCTTFVPAAAYFLNYGIRNPRPEPTMKEKVAFNNL